MKIVELVKSAKFCLKNPDPILITEDIENILRLTSEKLDSKMLEVEELKKSGWYISDVGLAALTKSNNDSKKVVKTLLNSDLREYGNLNEQKIESITGSLILQVQKVRNISAPKANEDSKTAPRLLKLQLTDGQTSYSALEVESISALSINTKPGTKILLKNNLVKMASGQMLLNPENVTVLGGEVPSLVEKWEVSQSLAKFAKGGRVGGAGGPPVFIPFGEKIQHSLVNPGDKAFKSLQSTKNKENEAENAEFNTLRQDAIAEASKAGTKKTFGGGSKQMLDSNVQKIMDKGYSQEQAETALRHSKNNLDRALANIKRRDERERQYQEGSGGAQGHREYSGGKRGAAAASTDGESKPSTKVSLFEFFEDKLNTDQEFSNISSHTAQNKRSGSYGNERFENNISSSFRSKGDKDGKFPQTNSASYSKSSHRSSTATTTSRVDSREPRDSRNSRDYRDSRDSRDSRDTRDSNSHPRDLRDKYSASSSYYQDRPKNGFAGKPTAQPYKHQGGREESGSYHKEYKDYNKTSYKGDYKPEYRGEARGEARGDNRDRDFKGKSTSNYHDNKKPDFPKTEYHPKPDYHQKPDYNSHNSQFAPSSYAGKSQNQPKHFNSKYDQPAPAFVKPTRQSTNIVEGMDKLSLGGKNDYKDYKGKPQSTHSIGAPAHSQKPQVVQNSQPPQNSQSNSQIVNVNNGNNHGNNHGKSPMSAPPPAVDLGKNNNAQFVNNTAVNGYHTKQQQFNPYNPYIGFQNKENNEYAKNMLKTQQPPPQPQSAPPQQQPQQMFQHSMPVTVSPPTPFLPPNTVHQMPQPFGHPMLGVGPQAVFHSNYHTIMMPPQMQHQPVIPTPLVNAKVGDSVLAKYWEDGQFYGAKITGQSDATFVVCFTEYGNHEEVSKTDCLPINTAPTTYPSFQPPTYRSHPQQIPQTFQQVQQVQQVHTVNLHSVPNNHYKTQPPPNGEVHKVYHHSAARGHPAQRGNGANKYRDRP